MQARENVPNVRNARKSENDGNRAGRRADVPYSQADVSMSERPMPDAGRDVSNVADVPSALIYSPDDGAANNELRGTSDGRERFTI